MRAQPNLCPPLPAMDPRGDHVIGGANRPGSRTYSHREGNVMHHIPVLAGQKICLGDIVTQNGDFLERVKSAATTGDGVNWGDVSRGAYMALAPVDTTNCRNGEESMPVYTYGAWVEVILYEDIAVNSRVGVDLRSQVDGKMVARTEADDDPNQRSRDPTLWKRVRAMSAEEMSDPVTGKAFLGRLVEILTDDGSGTKLNYNFGAVALEPQR